MTSKLFTPIKIGKLELKNRFMRSATWDAMADDSGLVTDRSIALYHELNTGGIGLIVTAFAFVSFPSGQAGVGQYGIYSDKMIPRWKQIIQEAHKNGSKIAMQIVHAGINSGYLSQKRIDLCAVSALPDVIRSHHEMTDEEWKLSYARCLGMFVSGDGLDERDERNRPIRDNTMLLLTNAHHECVPFVLPGSGGGMAWLPVLDTLKPDGLPPVTRFKPGEAYPLDGRTLALLVQVPGVLA